MMMVKRRKKVEADRPGKRLFLCSFIHLSVLDCPVGRCWGRVKGGGGGEVGGGEDVVPHFKDLINLFSKHLLGL